MASLQFMNTAQRTWLQAVSPLSYANPFLPERIELERKVLGSEFLEDETVWSYRLNNPNSRVNIARIMARLDPLLEQLRGRLRDGLGAAGHDLQLYEDAVLHLLYQRSYPKLYETGFGAETAAATPGRWKFYSQFLADWRHFFEIDGVRFPSGHEPRHTFACYRQIQRAFEYTYRDIIGSSLPAARLRASIWQSIFTHDIRRYRRTLYARLAPYPCRKGR